MQAHYAGHAEDGGPERRAGGLASAILSGFVASIVMLLTFLAAYTLALAASTLPIGELWTTEMRRAVPIFGPLERGGSVPAGEIPGGALIRLWLYNLTHNRAIEAATVDLFTAVALYLLGGVGWAVLYTRVAEPRLSGPGWLRGVKFSLAPALASLVVLLPLLGAGPFGVALGAGPLPVIGNLLLHLVYGTTLGQLSGPWGALDATTLQPGGGGAAAALLRSERMAARGVLAGLGVGAALGIVGPVVVSLGAGQPPHVWPIPALVLAAAVLGAALGGVIGSFVGLTASRDPRHVA
jgi:hypothetical protein